VQSDSIRQKALKIVTLATLLLLQQKLFSQTEYLVKVNAENGAYIKIDSIPGVMWITLSNYTTIDESKNRFFLNGSSDLSNWYLFTVDALSGKTIYKVPFPDNVFELQYGSSTNTLYGIKGGSIFNLIKIDEATGMISVITPLQDVSTAYSLTFDNNNHRLIFNGVNNEGIFSLFIVDVISGITTELPFANIQELQYDNVSNKLYGIYLDNLTEKDELVSVDISTGSFIPITGVLSITGIYPGNSTFDNKDHTFFFCCGR